jgi:hypothetical protein
MNRILSKLLLLVVLVGCQPYVNDKFFLHNESDVSLRIAYKSKLLRDTSFIVPRDSIVQIGVMEDAGAPKPLDEHTRRFFAESLMVYSGDSLIYREPPVDFSKWQFVPVHRAMFKFWQREESHYILNVGQKDTVHAN